MDVVRVYLEINRKKIEVDKFPAQMKQRVAINRFIAIKSTSAENPPPVTQPRTVIA